MGISRAAVLGLVVVALAGCAAPSRQSIEPEVLAAVQPVDVKLGIRQSELYAAFVPSTAGQAGAAACGAVPGLGILLAAACGGAFGAIDASVNASRAKEADEAARPLKDALIDFDVDRRLREALEQALEAAPRVQASDVAVIKTVTDPAYEQFFRDSQAASVMFVNADYQVVADFSAVQMSVRGSLFARSPAARAAARQPEDVPQGTGNDGPLAMRHASYRSDIVYVARLPEPGDGIEANVALWKADDARLLKAALRGGVEHLGRLLGEDLRRRPGAESAPQRDGGSGQTAAAEPAKDDGGTLARLPSGALQFDAHLPALVAAHEHAAAATVAMPAAATAPDEASTLR